MVRPFVKWPGGKSEEVYIIHQFLPQNIKNYIEPFLGGGASFLSLNPHQYEKAYLNDLSHELIQMYEMIKDKDQYFLQYLRNIWEFWSFSGRIFRENENTIISLYLRYKENGIEKNGLRCEVNDFIEKYIDIIYMNLPVSLEVSKEQLIVEIKKSIESKIKNVKKKEDKTGELPSSDYSCNFEVKTTIGGKDVPFYLSENERLFLEANVDEGVIVRVYNFDMDKKSGEIEKKSGRDFFDKYLLTPISYKVTLK